MRYLDTDFDPAVVAAIDGRLRAVADEYGATVLLAVESGSRAWGFPSPDSDYDCRFLYVRRLEEYLSLRRPRDVIEFPTDPVLDVNGWDLSKALLLLLKGNAVVIEWLTSPYVYAADARFRTECLALARQVVQPEAIARHYLHLGERQRRTYFSDSNIMEIKRLFYALRPAVALRWMRLHPGEAIAPMNFPALVAESNLPADVVVVVEDLLKRKAATRELGSGLLPASVAELIETEFAEARERWSSQLPEVRPASLAAADALFRRWVLPGMI